MFVSVKKYKTVTRKFKCQITNHIAHGTWDRHEPWTILNIEADGIGQWIEHNTNSKMDGWLTAVKVLGGGHLGHLGVGDVLVGGEE